MPGSGVFNVNLQFGLPAVVAGDGKGFLQQGAADAPVLEFGRHGHVVDVEPAEIVAEPGCAHKNAVQPGQEHGPVLAEVVLHSSEAVSPGGVTDPGFEPDGGNALEEVGIEFPAAANFEVQSSWGRPPLPGTARRGG